MILEREDGHFVAVSQDENFAVLFFSHEDGATDGHPLCISAEELGSGAYGHITLMCSCGACGSDFEFED